jgi:elongation factor P hydroxylase
MFDDALLKPDENTYDFEAYFQVNHRSGEIEPLDSANQAAQLRAKTTIDMYQLNKPQRLSSRKHELKHWRLTPPSERRLEEFSYRYFIDAS